jgi:hypothetical protein
MVDAALKRRSSTVLRGPVGGVRFGAKARITTWVFVAALKALRHPKADTKNPQQALCR